MGNPNLGMPFTKFRDPYGGCQALRTLPILLNLVTPFSIFGTLRYNSIYRPLYNILLS